MKKSDKEDLFVALLLGLIIAFGFFLIVMVNHF